MRPGNNPIESYKAAKGGDGLRIREDLPRFSREGYGSLTPADKELLKWVGVFFRKPTPGKFMMRIRMPNGFATSEQLATIAELSERLGNGTLDITTRQQLELRGYTLDGISEIWERLRGVNLRTLQTGMDNLRNFNGCPLAGLTPKELFDASPMVFELDRIVVGEGGNPEYTNLPRKMNVTVTGCLENCTHNESQDIALVPAIQRIDGGVTHGFHLLVGGKMGSGGFTIASNVGWFIPFDQAVQVVLEVIRIFRDEGPRDARTKCRLAFLLEEWGLDRFRAELVTRLGWSPSAAGQDARLDRHEDHLGVHPQKQPNRFSVGLSVTVGRIRHEQLREMARLAQVYGSGEVRLTTGQNGILVNVPGEQIDRLLKEPLLKELPPEPSRFFRNLVSCTGIQYCNLAVIETKARAVEVAKLLEERLGSAGEPVTIHWSGCPAGCGNHLAADIGLRGIRVNVGGQVMDAVEIYVGGRTGPNARAGQHLMSTVPCDEALPDVLATLIKHLELFKQVEPEPSAKQRVLMVPAETPERPISPMGKGLAPQVPFCFANETKRGGPATRAAPLWRRESPESSEGMGTIAVEVGRAEARHFPGQAAGAAKNKEVEKAQRFRGCPLDELRGGKGHLTQLQGRSIALFSVDGNVAAVDAECPHEGGPLQEGTLEEGCVVCPWHAYRFELASGRCTTEPGLSVRTYPTHVEDGTVWVEIPR